VEGVEEATEARKARRGGAKSQRFFFRCAVFFFVRFRGFSFASSSSLRTKPVSRDSALAPPTPQIASTERSQSIVMRRCGLVDEKGRGRSAQGERRRRAEPLFFFVCSFVPFARFNGGLSSASNPPAHHFSAPLSVSKRSQQLLQEIPRSLSTTERGLERSGEREERARPRKKKKRRRPFSTTKKVKQTETERRTRASSTSAFLTIVANGGWVWT